VLTVLTREQIRDLEDAATSERDKLVVRLLADTGMRLGELLSLTGQSLIEQGRMRYLKVHGKGDKERMIPLGPDLYRRLTKYIEKGRPQDTTSDRIFLTLRRSHRTGDYSPLEERATQEMFDVLRQRASIPDNVPCHPHALRHAFATNALRKGIGLIPLQHILGHTNLTQITNTYSHLTPEDDAAALLAVLRQD
jgi:integrase/recombinase XerC